MVRFSSPNLLSNDCIVKSFSLTSPCLLTLMEARCFALFLFWSLSFVLCIICSSVLPWSEDCLLIGEISFMNKNKVDDRDMHMRELSSSDVAFGGFSVILQVTSVSEMQGRRFVIF